MTKKTTFIILLFFALMTACAPDSVSLKSPSGNILVEVKPGDSLTYSVIMEGKTVVENSPLGLLFEGMSQPSAGIEISSQTIRELNEAYETRGKHTKATDHCNELSLGLKIYKSSQAYQLQIRAYDDGVALRYRVEDGGTYKIAGEATQWRFADGATAWLQDSEGKYMNRYKDDGFGTSGHNQATPGNHQRVYQAMYFESPLNELADSSVIGGPILLRLSGTGMYAWLAEGALMDYPGSRFQIAAPNTFGLTFPEENPWHVESPFATPWRLLVLSNDLNGIVNTDMHTNVCPPPTTELANADWIQAGRSTWSWYSGRTGDVKLQKQYADWASELGFEYNLIDGGWEAQFTAEPPYKERDHWEVLKEVVDYSLAQGVKTWVWQHSKNLKDPVAREEYLGHLNKAGVVGVKVDFFDTESRKTIEYMQALTEDAARHKIMLDFHGTPKPTGLSRTYPNVMAREANRGNEWHTRIWGGGRELTPKHNVITVFTRDVLGNNDYTPVIFNPEHLQGFTRAHQLAEAICYTSPFTCWTDQPSFYIESGVEDIIKSIPVLWEKTVVLKPSYPGKLAVIARFDGSRWFLGVMNGEKDEKNIELDLGFLGEGIYEAVLLGDDKSGDPVVFDRLEKEAMGSHDQLMVRLAPAGGYVARFIPVNKMMNK